ncbi:hypothetical protein ACHAXA_011099 [Cyclostephanos tholiformis]|uniref:Choline/carnitine acyltransferase domain-containing protein n=1 Tax=Cyclostephanos tholiformis TaxID=382380 RepID=A0ABD3SFC4_9STRA
MLLRQGTMRSSYNLVVAKSTTTSKSARPPPSPSSSSSYHRAMSIIPPKLKPWPHSMVESHGDYRSEAYLEDHIGGKLYSMQRSLPRLPVPNISDTITRLVPTVLPLARSDEERATFIKACEDFEGQAGELQRRLMERKEGEMRDSSWLQLWWNTLGYLQVRDPVVVNVSYFFHFSDDGTLPQIPSEKSLGVLRAASLLYSTAQFRQLVATGDLPHEAIGREPNSTALCSVAYKYMFNACRIPRKGEDSYRIYDPSLSSHVVVACGGRFFSFDFVEKETGEPLPLRVMEERLQKCVEMSVGGPSLPMLGYLTSDDRDRCAEARNELIRVGGSKMEEALRVLESGAVMICLDENERPVSRKQGSEIFWTGGLKSGHNRWFDKSIQLICTNNGKAGMAGEHSMMDGMPVVRYCDFITKKPYGQVAAESKNESGGYESPERNVKDIFGGCAAALTSAGSKVVEYVGMSRVNFEKLISSHELQTQSFQGYGSSEIKKMGYSPDAFVQMACQLATYRLWGEQGGTYEATQVRPFLHGRTETTRTVSPASEAFIKTMGLRPKQDELDAAKRAEKLELLRDAVSSHAKYISSAAKGMGVDRHLLGLALSLSEGETAPTLYSNPLYARAKTWRVSTSHLTHPRFNSWGYGEVTPTGVGLAYSIHPKHCMFCITALREHDWPERLSHLLEEALLEMQTLNDLDKAPTSKI